MLDATQLRFRVEQFGWDCKLSYEGDYRQGKYLMWINEVPVTDLPAAPPIKKDNIPVVCQSDNLVFLSDLIKRVTFQLFIKGLLHQFVAEHNVRSLCTFLEVDGKINKQWDGLTLKQFSEQPFTFYHLGQKFVLKWVIADPDSDFKDIFVLEANGLPLSQLEFLAPNFKIEDDDQEFFDATLFINEDYKNPIHRGSFEWRTGTLSHKIVEQIHDREIKSI